MGESLKKKIWIKEIYLHSFVLLTDSLCILSPPSEAPSLQLLLANAELFCTDRKSEALLPWRLGGKLQSFWMGGAWLLR